MGLNASDQDMLFSPIESQADLGCADKVSLVARRLFCPSDSVGSRIAELGRTLLGVANKAQEAVAGK